VRHIMGLLEYIRHLLSVRNTHPEWFVSSELFELWRAVEIANASR